MNNKYLVDTNLVVDFLRKKQKVADFLGSLDKIIVSVVTVGEIYQGVKNKRELKFIKEFFKTARILPINEPISDFSVELLEKYTLSHGLLILDAFIAATAIKHNLVLVTSNTRHFKMIKELRVESWHIKT